MTFIRFWKTYVKLVWPFKWLIAWALLWIMATAVFDLIYPYMLKVIFDLVDMWAGSDMDRSWSTQILSDNFGTDRDGMIYSAVVVLSLFFVIRLVLASASYYSNRASLAFRLELEKTLPVQVMEKLFSLSFAFHTSEHSGRKIEKLKNGTEAVKNVSYDTFFHMLPSLARIPVYMLCVAYFDWRIFLALIVLMPFAVALERYVIAITAESRKKRFNEYEDANSQAFEALANIFTVWTFGQENRERIQYKKHLDLISTLTWNEQIVYYKANLLRVVMMAVTMSMVIGLCLLAIDQRRMTSGTLILLLNLATMVIQHSSTLVAQWNKVLQEGEPMERLFEVLLQVTQITEIENAVTLDPLRGSITFEDVSFSYPDRENTLRNVNMEIKAGETIAIVGHSGGGKSTLLTLILRLLDVDSGRILVDGCDIRNLKLSSYRGKIGTVPQSIDLFATSIKENIAYGRPNASTEEIISAAKLANAHDFIAELPEGYETKIGERGAKLSGGQRQRIGIARALLIDPRILIFDEATSNLDADSENKIQTSLEAASKGRTTIIVAHRLSTIRNADRIFCIEEGRVAESGNWNELMKNNGPFRQLVELSQVSKTAEA